MNPRPAKRIEVLPEALTKMTDIQITRQKQLVPGTAGRTAGSRGGAAVLGLLGGLILFAGACLAFAAGYQVWFRGQIFPGVSVGGIELTGLELNQATDLLANEISFSLEGQVGFQDGDQIWMASPLELGLFLDARSSAQAAFRVGRRGGPINRLRLQWQAWRHGVDLAPLMIYDERSAHNYLNHIAAQIDRPVIEAHLGLSGIEVEVRSGQIGRQMDVYATLQQIETQFASLSNGILPLVVRETPPVILDVTEQATIARNILSAPLQLSITDAQEGDPGPWTFDPQTLANMLSIERTLTDTGEKYQVGLNTEDLRTFLRGISPDLSVDPVNARVIFNDETRELEVMEPATIGRRLLINETIQEINRQIAEGDHQIALAFETLNPPVTDDMTAAELGITELVHAETSYFYGSSAARIQNIETASASFHGLLIGPGETFSMASALGDVSLDNGYAEAWIIYGDRTIKGVGGGVCQVSTTLFRTVFFSGFPVEERYQHAYRVYYYELTAGNYHDPSLAGLDATVYVPLVDFKFTNDTPYWLLMETYVNPGARTLTWKFYSTSDGRSIEWHTTGLQNRVDPPEPLYQENPDLAKGEIRQVDWAVEGADVTVSRTVLRNGETYLQDSYFTHYVPWRAIYEYGPGTRGIPEQEEEQAGEPVG